MKHKLTYPYACTNIDVSVFSHFNRLVRGSVHHSTTIRKEKSDKMQQPSTYEKPEAANAVLGS